jgi:hypothetical protein
MPSEIPELFTEDEDSAAVPELNPAEPEHRIFERFATLIEQKNRLADQLKETEAEIARLQPHMLNFFAANPEFPRFSVRSLTIFPRRDLWVRPMVEGGGPEVCKALRASDLGHYVYETYNTSSLSAWVRELERAHASELKSGQISDTSELLPPALAAVLNVHPTYKVIAQRKARG